MPGYTWNVAYSSTTVTLAEAQVGSTAPGTVISGAAAVTNSYTRNEAFYEVPTSLTVRKVGEDGTTPLAGAVFTLERKDQNDHTVSSVSFTTGSDGTVVFNLLVGSVHAGEIGEGKYVLSETKAPEGYEATDTSWTVTVKEDDGELRVVLNENKNVFENFLDWIIGAVDPGTFEDGVLTVVNNRKTGSLTVQKTVLDPQNLHADEEYSFTLDASEDAFDQTFTLKANETYTVENIPWGTTYTLTEDTTDAAYTVSVTDEGSGVIRQDETEITVTNTYAYTEHKHPLTLMKVDADDNTKVLSGAGFTLYADEALQTPVGTEVFSDDSDNLELPIEAAGTYYLAETTAPTGYHSNPLTYLVTAEEKSVVKNVGTADAVTEMQMHIRAAGLNGTTENEIDYTYTVENTAIKTVPLSVKKVWHGGNYHARPESVTVTLYRDGTAYDTVTLNEAVDWSYTWEDLTDEFEWTVDEPSVPSGYSKTVSRSGNSFTITNTLEDIPKTGDFSNLLGFGAMATVSVLGFGTTALSLVAPRKKKEDDE